ncbi:DUF7779 domain-containing protein [Streptomyces flaveolus]|uniref:DUF7779 domain-containing protein n=1 Tax=Streptomyces flaveolus TaxID=67297 RepID=UPI003702863C
MSDRTGGQERLADGRPAQTSISAIGQSIAAHTIHGGVHLHQSPREPVQWPQVVGRIPARADMFRNRAEVAALAAALAADGATGAVLNGLAGTGKTQLAADYAHTGRADGSLDLVVWITANNATAVASGYAQAGQKILGLAPSEPQRAADEFREWLEPRRDDRPCRWLVVLDDVTDLSQLRDWLPPESPHGRTLITTHRRDPALRASHRPTIQVGAFNPVDAVDHLARVLALHDRVEPATDLRALAADLGHLPLALTQAAAYLAEAQTTCADYREKLAKRGDALAVLAPTMLPDKQARTVAAVFALSIERADHLQPAGLARELLQVSALLDPNGIPGEVLAGSPVLGHLSSRRNNAASLHWVTAEEVALALGGLHRLSLIDYTRDDPRQTVRVHQLVQRAARTGLSAAAYTWRVRVAADALVAVWPEVETDPGLAQALRACATALFGHAEDVLYRTDAHPLLLRHGRSTDGAGLPVEALAHFTRYIDTARRRLGPNHRDTLTARYHAAGCQGRAGDPPAAVEALAALLEAQTRALGADDIDTLRTRSSLAVLRTHNDRGEELAELLALLDDQVRVLGPDHRDVDDTTRRAFILAAELGHREQAIIQLTRLLASEEERFDADDPATQATREALAALGAGGEPAASDPGPTQLAEVLDDQIRVLGPDHRDTLATRRKIALVVGNAGRYTEAVDSLVELLGDETRALGPDDRDSFATWSMIGLFRVQSDGPAAGVETLRELLRRQIRILGPDHIDTLSTRGDLADWLGFATSAADAVVAEAELITDLVRVVGPDHKTTVGVLGELDEWQRRSRTKRELAETVRGSYETMVTIVGPAHPSAVQVAGQLAQMRAEEGDRRAAATALEQTLAALVERLGPDHLAVAVVRANLDFWREA